MRPLRLTLAAAAVATGGAAWWWRAHPSACPYGQRFWVKAPHPVITRKRLLAALEPAPSEVVLEVGPGTGYYTFAVAECLADGTLSIFDLQQKMLDHVMREADRRGAGNVEPTQGDARGLPYPDAAFDAAYLVTVLGEIPDQDAALRELARVLKPGGRLVVGELFGDPHMVTSGRLRRETAAAGLEFERRHGNRLAFFERFRRPA